MNCEILISQRMSAIPIVECGGLVLQPGDALVVSTIKGSELKKNYGPLLIVAGFETRDTLRGGDYEYQAAGVLRNVAAPKLAAVADGLEPPAFAGSDKTMVGKSRVKRK